ncbi:hypothetical protein HPB48_014095 [Haemaphysalis longicornis]|uniref:Uncharacterized protein n=1 Tax=Haemaphysalis longicornis TaxID=44386 RepID=A0A9J6FJJ3_HAELO|nr:hypothetical protein HPB48_014095 [Haemaphysalis longicornis]
MDVIGTIAAVIGLPKSIISRFELGLDPNLRYTVARVSNSLGSNLYIRDLQDGDFMSILLDRGCIECLEWNDLTATIGDEACLRGLFLLIAGILSQVFFRLGDRFYMDRHAACCMPTMNPTLLQSPTKNKVKCTTQGLRTAGSAIESLDLKGDGYSGGIILDTALDKPKCKEESH